MLTRIALVLSGVLVCASVSLARPEPQSWNEPTILVTGRGEVSVRPDRAVVRLGAFAQEPTAVAAQARVNQIMQQTMDALKGAGIAEKSITTDVLSLTPIYEPFRQGMPEGYQPKIVAYRADNRVRVEVDAIDSAGKVVDACMKAGVNQLEGITFELKDDGPQKREALAKAVTDAKSKADAIAGAAGVQVGAFHEIVEGGANIIPPQPMFRGAAMMADAASAPTQVSPGQVRVDATVTIRYRIAR